MKGDFTRLTHRPADGYVGVLMQQGRVTVDADWNEQVAADRRRWRLQTIDTIGRACAPEDNPGFAVEPTPDGLDLIIHRGRIYVEGHLVELEPGTEVAGTRPGPNRINVADPAPDGQPFAEGQWVQVADDTGAPQLVRINAVAAAGGEILDVDGDLSSLAEEVTVRRVITYLTQPFHPAAAGPPFADSFDPEEWRAQTHLLYLDVWERHVTAVEDPRLREPALGGPDTATRIQLAWAVRLLRDVEGDPVAVGDAGCGASLDAWDALVAPAGARMSARADAPGDPLDPCVVPLEGGYRGLENRLYRVEVHDPGPLGTATFKWSRDNGTVLSAIRDFVPGAPFRVEVSNLGRDRELRFRAGDVVEAESDISELSGQPGTLAEVDGQPDEARRLVPLDTDVSLYANHPRPRLRRWDHAGAPLVTSDAWTELEDGVQVRFTGGPFRTGDWWVIPARTATGDVEGVVDAPPRGVEHSYARLALVSWEPVPAVEDCRSTFPTLCHRPEGGRGGCCTISVGDDVSSHGDVDSLAEAVALAHQLDGPVRICLLPGNHRVDGPVELRRSLVTIAGCGPQSPVVSTQGGVLTLLGATEVRLERLFLRSASTDPTVLALRTADLVVEDCDIRNHGGTDENGGGGVRPGPGDISAGEGGGGGGVQPGSGGIAVGTNRPPVGEVFVGGVRPAAEFAGGTQPTAEFAGTRPAAAEFLSGAQPTGEAGVLAGARPVGGAAFTGDFTAGELSGERPALGLGSFVSQPIAPTVRAGPALVASRAVGVTVRRCRLAGWPSVYFTGRVLMLVDNLIRGAVVLDEGTDTADIRHNLIVSGPAFGVQLGLAGPADAQRPNDLGLAQAVAGPAFVAPVEPGFRGIIAGVRIRGNTIAEHARGGIGTPLELAGRSRTEVIDLVVEHNRIADCGHQPLSDLIGIGGGILLLHASDVRIEHNTVVGNGPRNMDRGFALAAGIVVVDGQGLVVRDNVVRDNHAGGSPEVIGMSAGVVGAMITGDGDDRDGDTAFGSAATISCNHVRVEGGPAVVLLGAGAMAVTGNHLSCRYGARSLGMLMGRAVMVVNLGAAADTGVAGGMTQYRSSLRYGPVKIDDNQIAVQERGEGRGPLSPDVDWRQAQLVQLLRGSAVMALTADDLSFQANQVTNAVEGERLHIASSVWALGLTVRAIGNRLDETAGTAVFSYAGQGQAAHVVTGNVATHCLRVDGARQAVSDNIELLCFRLQPAEHLFHHIRV